MQPPSGTGHASWWWGQGFGPGSGLVPSQGPAAPSWPGQRPAVSLRKRVARAASVAATAAGRPCQAYYLITPDCTSIRLQCLVLK